MNKEEISKKIDDIKDKYANKEQVDKIVENFKTSKVYQVVTGVVVILMLSMCMFSGDDTSYIDVVRDSVFEDFDAKRTLGQAFDAHGAKWKLEKYPSGRYAVVASAENGTLDIDSMKSNYKKLMEIYKSPNRKELSEKMNSDLRLFEGLFIEQVGGLALLEIITLNGTISHFHFTISEEQDSFELTLVEETINPKYKDALDEIITLHFETQMYKKKSKGEKVSKEEYSTYTNVFKELINNNIKSTKDKAALNKRIEAIYKTN